MIKEQKSCLIELQDYLSKITLESHIRNLFGGLNI